MTKSLKYLTRKLSLSHGSKQSELHRSAGNGYGEDDEEFFDAATALLHSDAHEDGGLACTNKAVLDAQRNAISEVVKQIGKQLLAGKLNLINLSLPVKMFEPRSYLEKLTDVWVYPRILKAASDSRDPVERMRLLVTWFVAGVHLAFVTWRKPFNPLLGETWQARLGDGTAIFLEQISHHPPISAFQMVGPDEAYVFSGLSQPEVQAKLPHNSIRTTAKGYRCMAFKDGTSIQIMYPSYDLKGVLYSSSLPRGELVGSAHFVDTRNRLVCSISFGGVEGASEPLLLRSDSCAAVLRRTLLTPSVSTLAPPPALSSWWGSKSLNKGSGGSGKGGPSQDVILARGTGNWLARWDWDGRRYWTLAADEPEQWQAVLSPLPSDTRFRTDVAALAREDLESAQEAKEELEMVQRLEAKLRKHNGAHV